MKLGIVGPRKFNDYEFVSKHIDQYSNIDFIITSNVQGVDQLALQYAKEHNISTIIKNANWQEHGQYASIYRNSQIIEISDTILFINDDKSFNTRNCIELAKSMNKPMQVINYCN